MDMDKIWRMLTANFLLLVGIAGLVMAVTVFQNSGFAAVGIYGSFVLIPWGIAKGLFVMIDHSREQKEKE